MDVEHRILESGTLTIFRFTPEERTERLRTRREHAAMVRAAFDAESRQHPAR